MIDLRVSRADDDRLILAIEMRRDGVPHAKIAATLGINRRTLRSTADNVRNADLKESGEPSDVVIQSYWSRR